MLEVVLYAVGSKFALDVPARAAGTVALGTAALNHEAGDDTVERQAVIKALLHQLFEVLAGDRGNLRIQLDLDLLSVFHFDNYHFDYLLSAGQMPVFFSPLYHIWRRNARADFRRKIFELYKYAVSQKFSWRNQKNWSLFDSSGCSS